MEAFVAAVIVLIFHLCHGVAANEHLAEIKHARFPERKTENVRLPGETQCFWLENSFSGGKWQGSK